jgi:hypothetical protein
MKIVVMVIIFEASQALIKKQQPEVIGFGVASFTDQNLGLPWTHVKTACIEVMNNALQ